MKRDEAGIPENYHQSITQRSNWLAYLLSRAITCLDNAGLENQANALYKADADWLKHHVKSGER